jgi:hypothetical protein
MARPIEWIQEKKEKAIEVIIFEMVENGKSINSILSSKDRDNDLLPNKSTFFEWLRNDKELSNHYATAYEARAEILFDEIIDIADDTSNDTTYTETGEKANTEWINRSRLRVDARKWILSKMNPKKYGDKTDITTNGKDVTTPYKDWTDEQLKSALERLRTK